MGTASARMLLILGGVFAVASVSLMASMYVLTQTSLAPSIHTMGANKANCSLQPSVLLHYPLDSDEISKYYVDPVTGAVCKKYDGPYGVRWCAASDRFYDCPQHVQSKYVKGNVKRSPHFKAQEGEDRYMYEHFFHSRQERKHYFVELGALDGVQFSNSYFFEKELQWGGVLIEGETSNYMALEKNRGQGHSSNVTVMHTAICEKKKFIHMWGTGNMAGVDKTKKGHRTTVPCLPMHEILSMVSLPYVDFYSIDVEGAELDVITSHDFTAVPVHTLMIEMRPADEDNYQKTGNARVRRALHARGFCRYANIVGHNNEVWVNASWVEPVYK